MSHRTNGKVVYVFLGESPNYDRNKVLSMFQGSSSCISVYDLDKGGGFGGTLVNSCIGDGKRVSVMVGSNLPHPVPLPPILAKMFPAGYRINLIHLTLPDEKIKRGYPYTHRISWENLPATVKKIKDSCLTPAPAASPVGHPSKSRFKPQPWRRFKQLGPRSRVVFERRATP